MAESPVPSTSAGPNRLVDIRAASAGTLLIHATRLVPNGPERRYARKLVNELVRRIGAEKRRREAFTRRIGAASMIEYRLDREKRNG